LFILVYRILEYFYNSRLFPDKEEEASKWPDAEMETHQGRKREILS